MQGDNIFYFLNIFLGITGWTRNDIGQQLDTDLDLPLPFNGIGLDLDLDNSFWIRQILNFCYLTTLTFGFSHQTIFELGKLNLNVFVLFF